MTDSHADSPYNRRLTAMLERCSASPSTMRAHLEASLRLDYSHALRSVQCPTTAVLIAGSSLPVGAARYKLLARIGDTAYRALLTRHERDVRFAVTEAGGTLVSIVGDGTFSLFDGPLAAVQCARRIVDDAHRLGVEARPGEVLVSRQVRELAADRDCSSRTEVHADSPGCPARSTSSP
ncbi:hypothetical protein [Rhodococcus sp. CH91]|uniref:hypothetical protein n=1 Tax=Rhodococcus sp. CH91 TaxID=2910256 RepID=UPI0027DF7029|nr:hypothetical protein [Rhodococcus sp. CH91]